MNDVILGNFIGTDINGAISLGNTRDGIRIENAAGAAVTNNVLSANGAAGLEILGQSATATAVQGNLIGTDAHGTIALANELGVFLNDVVGNTIGGSTPGARNLISGNRSIGIQVIRVSPPPSAGSIAPDNVIQGNYIGTNITGTSPLGNGSNSTNANVGIGVFLNNTRNDLVIGNVISGNNFAGISIFGQAGVPSANNQVLANLIGPAFDGTPLRGTDPTSFTPSNRQDLGVVINNSTGNIIGGPGFDANLIEDNIAGVEIVGTVSTTHGNPLVTHAIVNQVQFNTITRNLIGVYLNETTNNVIINNTIVGNASIGVALVGNLTTDNLVQGNNINSNRDAASNPTNGTGVYIESASNNFIQDNTITKNGLVGVYLFNGATGNLVRRNRILKNLKYGVFLYNSAGNVNQIIRRGADSNRLQGNVIANFREFTGPVLRGRASRRRSHQSFGGPGRTTGVRSGISPPDRATSAADDRNPRAPRAQGAPESEVEQSHRLQIERPRAGHRLDDAQRDHQPAAEFEVHTRGQVHHVGGPRPVGQVVCPPVVQRRVDVGLERRHDPRQEAVGIGVAQQVIAQAQVVVQHRHIEVIDREAERGEAVQEEISPGEIIAHEGLQLSGMQ